MPFTATTKYPNVDFSGGSLGAIVAAYDPFTDGSLVPLAAWDADDPATYTLDGSNNVLTLPSKFNSGVISLHPSDGTNTHKAIRQATGWPGSNPRVGQSSGACFSTVGQSDQYGGYIGLTKADLDTLVAALPGGALTGMTVFSLAMRGAAQEATNRYKPIVYFPGFPKNTLTPPYEQSCLGVMADAADATSAVCGQHQSNIASDASAAGFTPNAKGVLCGVTSSAGHAIGINGLAPAGTGPYFDVVSQNASFMLNLFGGYNLIGASFTGLVKIILIYATATLTTAQRQKIEGYLAWRGGIQSQLPSTHPFYTRGPLVTD